MSAYRKRKHTSSRIERIHDENDDFPQAPPSHLYIQAYEADIIKGTQAEALARSLEPPDASGSGSSLIKWALESSIDPTNTVQGVWVDRYDARLLLESLPSFDTSQPADGRQSPTGWSDLPSDTEDTFFFSPEETEDFHREKRRRIIEQSREDRLKALRAEREEEPQEDIWGGSDEEPDEAQKELMKRTASHLASSPNPAQLEMRILANHGADNRFAFLRGRWSHAWKAAKARARLELIKEKTQINQNAPGGALGGLSGYGASDDESDSGQDDESPPAAPIPEDILNGTVESESEELLKEARRAKAKEWAEKRRIAKAGTEQPNPS